MLIGSRVISEGRKQPEKEQAVSRIVARSGQICRYMAGSGHNQPEIKKQTEEDPTGKRPPKGAVRKDQGQQNNVITKMSQ